MIFRAKWFDWSAGLIASRQFNMGKTWLQPSSPSNTESYHILYGWCKHFDPVGDMGVLKERINYHHRLEQFIE